MKRRRVFLRAMPVNAREKHLRECRRYRVTYQRAKAGGYLTQYTVDLLALARHEVEAARSLRVNRGRQGFVDASTILVNPVR